MPRTSVAEAYLALLCRRGVEWLFANAGTDFAPIIEALSRSDSSGLEMPCAVAVAHETVAVGMAHGYALATGRPQAVMLHVDVGVANGLVGLMNASRANVPMLFTSGRTPYTEAGLAGSRDLPIHWGQEMSDQTGLVREHVKWAFELARPEQLESAVERALAIATSPPQGPVYLSLPRETLAATWPGAESEAPEAVAASGAYPDPASIAATADLVAAAERPLVVSASCARADRPSLGAFAERFGLPVVEFWSGCQALSTEHPMHAGFDPGPRIAEADLVLALDVPVPWIPLRHQIPEACPVVHIGPDPTFSHLPLRGHRSSMAITSEVEPALGLLGEVLEGRSDFDGASRRRASERVSKRNEAERQERRERARQVPEDGIATRAWSSSVLDEVLGGEAWIFNELGCAADVMHLPEPGSLFGISIAGGLGWGVPAALGAQLADRDRLVVATVGDGSYVFANPVACHQTAQTLELPVLIVVFNNSGWEAVRGATLGLYPEGAAAAESRMPLSTLEPAPRFDKVVEASGGYGERVVEPGELEPALKRALAVVRDQRRQALVDVRIRFGR
ncbi:MAG: thiamine pyrophosphate-requiring protein [Acidobacteriota bacterium]|nr:thiamine pyrophosphate-requiring protein [Acidobacteriota bacterium]